MWHFWRCCYSNWTTSGCKHPHELDKVMEVVRRMLYGHHLVCFETMSKEVHWVRLLVRKVVSWTALISEYAEYVYVEEVQYMMNQDYIWKAWKSTKPINDISVWDVVSWDALILGYGEKGHVEKALNSLKKVKFEGQILPKMVQCFYSWHLLNSNWSLRAFWWLIVDWRGDTTDCHVIGLYWAW